MFELLLLWIPLCAVVAWAAAQKGRSGVGFFFLSLFLTPLIGLLVVIAVPRLQGTTAAPTKGGDLILCHACNNPRRYDSLKCPRCGAGARPEPKAMKKCPMCAEMIQPDAIKCRYCGADQPEDEKALARSSAPLQSIVPPTMGYCPGCRKLRASNVMKCVVCGNTEPVATG